MQGQGYSDKYKNEGEMVLYFSTIYKWLFDTLTPLEVQ